MKKLMKGLLVLLAFFLISDAAVGQGTPPSRSGKDSLSVDTDGNGVLDTWLYASPGVIAHLKKGANITFTVSATGDTLTIESSAGGSGTSDSVGIDTDGNGTIDAVLYSTGGLFAYALKPGAGITMTVNTDTVYIASTLGVDISSAEIINQTIDKTDIDSTVSNVVFDNAYEGTSAEPDSGYATRNFVKKEILDSLAEYILRNGSRLMTANWSYGNFDLTGANVGGFDTVRTDALRALGGESSALLLEADTLKPDADKEMWLGTVANKIRMLNLYDFELYTAGNNGGAYDTSDVPSNLQQLTWVTGGILRWENQGSGGGGNVFKLGADTASGAQASYLINNDTVVVQGSSTVRIGHDDQTVDTLDFSVVDGSLLDVKMANNALDADKIVGDANDDDDLDVAAGGTGVSTLTDGGLLLGAGSGDITALGVAGNGQIPIGDGTTAPVLGTITAVANETDVTNGAGAITIGIVDPLIVGKGGTGVATLTDG